jgi:hypothetical protein
MFISGKSPEPKRSGPPQVESDAKDQWDIMKKWKAYYLIK